MANGIQTANGKAFEYACLLSLYLDLSGNQNVEIVDSPQLKTARELFETMPNEKKRTLMAAGRFQCGYIMHHQKLSHF